MSYDMSSKQQNNDTKQECVDVDNMKPVAWAIKHQGDLIEFQTDKSDFEKTLEFYKLEGWEYAVVRLYTAPRELSDEEIINLYAQVDGGGILAFARAVIKKASEK